MTEHHPTPDKEQIALLEPFERLNLQQIQLDGQRAQQAACALQELAGVTALGFDTESKPTFVKNEASTGPHIVQLSTLERAYIFQLEDAECRRAVAVLLEPTGSSRPALAWATTAGASFTNSASIRRACWT